MGSLAGTPVRWGQVLSGEKMGVSALLQKGPPPVLPLPLVLCSVHSVPSHAGTVLPELYARAQCPEPHNSVASTHHAQALAGLGCRGPPALLPGMRGEPSSAKAFSPKPPARPWAAGRDANRAAAMGRGPPGRARGHHVMQQFQLCSVPRSEPGCKRMCVLACSQHGPGVGWPSAH